MIRRLYVVILGTALLCAPAWGQSSGNPLTNLQTYAQKSLVPNGAGSMTGNTIAGGFNLVVPIITAMGSFDSQGVFSLSAHVLPAFGGDVTCPAGNPSACVVTRFNGNAVAAIATSGSASDLTSGILNGARMPSLSGDCSSTSGTTALSCTKTGGVSFAASATIDTTNAGNIASGTLPAARLPAPTVSTLGGVKSGTAATHQYQTGIDGTGALLFAQPDISDITNTSLHLLPHVANNAALALRTDYSQPVVRDNLASVGDSGRDVFNHSVSPCSITGGDGGSQVPAADNGCWLVDPSIIRFTPQMFGNVSTNAVAAIQAADAAASRLGRTVFFPGSVYSLSAPVVPSAGAKWEGQSYQTTILQTTSASADVIDLNNSFVTLDGFQIQSSVTRTSGAYINAVGTDYNIKNIRANGAFNALVLGANTGNDVISNFYSQNAVSGSGVDVVINGCTNCLASQVTLTNSPSARPFAHMVINNMGDLHCYDCNILQASNDIYIDPSSGQGVSSLKFIGGYLDEAGTSALAILPSGTGSVTKLLFSGTWFKTEGTNDVQISPSGTATVDFVQCVGCEFYGPASVGGNGFAATQSAGTTVKNIQIIGGGAGSNTYGYFFNGVTSFQLSDAVCGMGLTAAPTTCVSLSGTIGTASLHDVHNSASATPLANTATITTNNIHNNY